MPSLLPLPTRSELPPLAHELHSYRCVSAETGRACELEELNDGRARTAAWLTLGGDAQKIRVERVGRPS